MFFTKRGAFFVLLAFFLDLFRLFCLPFPNSVLGLSPKTAKDKRVRREGESVLRMDKEWTKKVRDALFKYHAVCNLESTEKVGYWHTFLAFELENLDVDVTIMSGNF